jgi:integrase
MNTLRKLGQAGDNRWLERRRKVWYCCKDIPLPLRRYFVGADGKQRKRLIRSLGTESLEVARQRRHAVLALFEAEFARVRAEHAAEAAVANSAAWYDKIVQAASDLAVPREKIMQVALERRDDIARVRSGDTRGIHIDKDAPLDPAGTPQEKAMSLVQWALDDEAELIADAHGEQAAYAFRDIAQSVATPFEPLIAGWLSESDIEARSKGDHQRAVNELLVWCRETNRRQTIEAVDRKAAGAYVSRLLSQGMDRQKTISKRLWSLSSLWRFLIRKGHCETNVWLGHGGGQQGRSGRDKVPERPFTPAELHKLVDGPAEPVLADLMRLAFYSGARIEELSLLRVRDIDVKDQTMAIHADPKSTASRRVVPVHSEVWPIVAARIKAKAADAFLLDELGPAPKEGRQRSMAISKAFGRYRETVGVDDTRPGQRRSLVNFHSFRRTFVTLAEQAGQPESTICSVVGHKREGMTFGTYSGGPSLAQRRACVEAVLIPPAG